MPLVRSDDNPQVPLLFGPKCQINVWSSLTSCDAMWSKPSWVAAPTSGLQIASTVNLTSLAVNAEPSDHFKPFFSLMVTSMVLASIFLTRPLSVVGTSVTRSGIGLFCESNPQGSAQTGPVSTCCVVCAELESTFRS